MGNYSKLIGSIIGGIAGLLVARGVLPAVVATPDNVTTVVAAVGILSTAASAIATFLFPANKPPT